MSSQLPTRNQTALRASLVSSVYANSIVETVREPLLLLTEDRHVVLANASFCQTFRLPRNQVEEHFLYEVSAGEWNIPTLRSLLEDLLVTNIELRDFEVEQAFRRLGLRTMLLNGRRLQHDDESVALILLAFEDITERRRLERALHTTVAEREASNGELHACASVASHDLQEPLRKIRAFGERLEQSCRGVLPPDATDYLARMLSAATRMQALIADLLSLARITARDVAKMSVDLNATVHDAGAELELLIARSGGQLEVGTLPTVCGEPTQLRQLFVNLIGNAFKFRSDRYRASGCQPQPLTGQGCPSCLRASVVHSTRS
jgi:two-component system CheB/CheR fusion protein